MARNGESYLLFSVPTTGGTAAVAAAATVAEPAVSSGPLLPADADALGLTLSRPILDNISSAPKAAAS